MEEFTETNNKKDLAYVFIVAIAARFVTFYLFPIDWNWDSYHHWQISLLSLRVGFSQGRLWDLNGCEYYWGVLPHLIQSSILWILKTTSMQPYRLFNIIFGSINSVIVYFIGSKRSKSIGFKSGLLYALFPFALFFDVLGLQDTIALTFVLIALCLFDKHPFWSGTALALAAQSRNEILLISIMIVTWILLIDRLSTNRMPFLIGWVLITLIFSTFIFSKTGNPIYGLYWNLYSVFKSVNTTNHVGFLEAMVNWVISKLRIWPSKLTGVMIIVTVSISLIYFVYTMKRRPKKYDMVFFLSTAALTAPIYLTYLGSENRMFMIMARIINPVAALGLPMLLETLQKFQDHKGFSLFTALVVLFIGSSIVLAPSYLGFEEESKALIEISDRIGEIYIGGTIICDYPMMNYYLINNWHVDPVKIQGSHYSPHYYGSNITNDYLKWLWNQKATLFVRYGEDSEVVFYSISSSTTGVLVKEFEQSEIECYTINSKEILRELG